MIKIWKYTLNPKDKSMVDIKRLISNSTFYDAKDIEFILDIKTFTLKEFKKTYIPLIEYAQSLKLNIEIYSNFSVHSVLNFLVLKELKQIKIALNSYKRLDDRDLPKHYYLNYYLSKTFLFIGILFLTVALVNGIFSLYRNIQYQKQIALVQENKPVENSISLSDEELAIYHNRQSSLLSISPDYLGWIEILDTKINFPFVQGFDNQYYLDHDYLKDESIYGSIYMDYRVQNMDDTQLVLFGHSVHNSQMFGYLSLYETQTYFDNHQTLKIYMPNEIRTYTVFAVELIDANSYILNLPIDKASLQTKMNNMVSNSIIKSSFPKTDIQQIITLVTCEYSQDNGRIFVSAYLNSIEVINPK